MLFARNINRRSFFPVLLSLLIVTVGPLWPGATYAAPLAQEAGIPACFGESAIESGVSPCQDIQVLFIIDDSGSMQANDPIQARFAGVENTVNILGEVYLQALEAQSRRRPKIYVSAIHFARDIDLRTGWVLINPVDRKAWESDGVGGETSINKTLIPDSIRNLTLTSARTTNFINPFRDAVELFATAPPVNTDCANRIVMLLTDGAPDLGSGPLTGKPLKDHFEDVKEYAAALKDTFGSRIFVSGLNDQTRLADYWRNSEIHWQEIAAGATLGDLLGAVKIEDKEDENGQLVGMLAVLRDRIQVIIEATIGLKGESVVGTQTVPPYLEFLRISYFAPTANASLNVFDPDDRLIAVDGELVTLTGAGTPDQVIKILNPKPGEYRFEPSEPGGSIRLLFSYPSFEEVLPLELEKDVFQQYTNSQLGFLVKNLPAPQEGFPLRFEAHLTTPGQQIAVLKLAVENDDLQIPFLPFDPGIGELFVDVIIKDKDGWDCLLYRSEAADFDVEAVKMVAKPVDPEVCTPSGMPVRFPIELRNAETNALTAISLPIKWQLEAVHENGSPVKVSVLETGEAGVYQFSLSTAVAGRIATSVTASVSHKDSTAPLYEDTFKTTRLVQDRFYTFELTGVKTLANFLPIWTGKQTIQVSGRYFDAITGESVAGIQRFQVTLVPDDGGEAVAPVDTSWQAAGEGEYTLTFTAPASGTYQIITAYDDSLLEPCEQVDTSGIGLIVILVNRYWEYRFWILMTLALVTWWIVRLRYLPRRDVHKPAKHMQDDQVGQKKDDEDEQHKDDEDEDKPDDLQKIEGIGPVVEKLLNENGIKTYKQLAEAESRIEQIRVRLNQAGYFYMYPDSWPGQAKLAAEGDWEGLRKLKDELRRGRPVEPDESLPD